MRPPRNRVRPVAVTMTRAGRIGWWSRAALMLAAPFAVSACAYRHGGIDRGMTFAAARFAARPVVPIPPDNPMTPGKIALGRDLFNDTRLSGDGTRSCATCHQPDKAFADGVARFAGLRGHRLDRNTPGLINIGFARRVFIDGRAASLEEQALGPITSPDEMGRAPGHAVDLIRADPRYRARFKEVFGASVSEANVAKALAAFQRTLVSGVAPFDRWAAGDVGAISPAAARGFAVFAGRGKCLSCHSGANFTDDKFHNVGLPGTDPGRGAITGRARDTHAFRTPSLREIGRTAPYMHDGSLASLEAVVDHYSDDIKRLPHTPRAAGLNRDEKADLVAFLRTLQSDRETRADRMRDIGAQQ